MINTKYRIRDRQEMKKSEPKIIEAIDRKMHPENYAVVLQLPVDIYRALEDLEAPLFVKTALNRAFLWRGGSKVEPMRGLNDAMRWLLARTELHRAELTEKTSRERKQLEALNTRIKALKELNAKIPMSEKARIDKQTVQDALTDAHTAGFAQAQAEYFAVSKAEEAKSLLIGRAIDIIGKFIGSMNTKLAVTANIDAKGNLSL
jgi:hypothetical protein